MKRTTGLLIGLALVLSLTALTGVLIATTNDAAAATVRETTSSVTPSTLSADVAEAYAEARSASE